MDVPDVIIVGGGIMGVSAAYFLTVQFNQRCVIVEKASIGAGASGKAGGFLARDWSCDYNLTDLYVKGFDLHVQLAKELSLSSHHDVHTFSVHHATRADLLLNPAIPHIKSATVLESRPSVVGTEPFIQEELVAELLDRDTAQVVPMEVLQRMMEVAVAHGLQVVDDAVDGLLIEGRNVVGVELQCGEDLRGRKVLMCMGPWTGVASNDWLQDVSLPIFGIRASSIVFENVPEHVVERPWSCFCAHDSHGCFLELHARKNRQLMVTGTGKSARVQGDELRMGGTFSSPTSIPADEHQVVNALSSLREQFAVIEAQEPTRVQGCMMPVTTDALPYMGAVPRYENLFVCAGHGCWGILCGPVSGLCMAELLTTGNCTTVDLSNFDPARCVDV